MFDVFRRWYEERHEYARRWKQRTGGKVVGYFCTYVPEELLYAAGLLPVRVLGSHEPQDVSEPHIYGMFCPFCRDVLAQGLLGRYDYLDGIVMAHSCIHLTQAFLSWYRHLPLPYSYYLYVPAGIQSPRSRRFLRQQLQDMRRSLEQWLGREITDEDLRRGIALVNESRRRLRELYQLRRDEDPHLTGLEAMYAVVSSQMVHKEDHNVELQRLLKQLPERSVGPGRLRLLVVGSENDDVEFIRMLESFGSLVVVDDHCTGSRYFWNETPPLEDPLEAIAERYIQRPPCPQKDWPGRRRGEHLLQLAREYNVRAVILIQQKFCDPHEFDIPYLKRMFEDNGIPCYFFELDVTVPIGQFRVRFEAFLEMLQAEELPF